MLGPVTGSVPVALRVIAAPSSQLAGTVMPVMVGLRFRRSSSDSTARRHRGGAWRMVRSLREANRLRSQERVATESLLGDKAGPQCKGGYCVRGAHIEPQA